ncbi:polysaccharide export protein [Fundidesulfovibrio butyratiphilus]
MNSEKNADVVVKDAADVAKLEKMETGLELTRKDVANNPRLTVLDGTVIEKLPEYRIGPGDILEVVYHINYTKSDENYRLQVQDRINVLFPFNPQFNASAVVRTDGLVTLPLVGEVMVEGATPLQVQEVLAQKYRKYILNPKLSVSLEESNVKIEELKRAVTTASRGQSKTSPVAPDGTAGFPLVGNIRAQGLTVRQLEKVLSEKYNSMVKNLQVNLILNEIHYSKCYVLGEVDRPGVYPMPGRESLLAVMARAGGIRTTANLSNVIIFRNDGLDRPMAIKVDLSETTDKALSATNITLHPADIVYVPKGAIDNFNDLVNKIFTKGLYTIVPFSSSVSATYDLRNTYNVGGSTITTP